MKLHHSLSSWAAAPAEELMQGLRAGSHETDVFTEDGRLSFIDILVKCIVSDSSSLFPVFTMLSFPFAPSPIAMRETTLLAATPLAKLLIQNRSNVCLVTF